MNPPTFPVHQARLHKASFIDYQLRRLVGCGYADPDTLSKALVGVRRFPEVAKVLGRLAQEAQSAGSLRRAMAYQRGAEFFTPATSQGRLLAYERFLELFAQGFEGEGWTRHEVPYAGGFLPAYRMPARHGPARDVVLVHGGFDSVIEEFVGIWMALAEAGFDVIAFEGPGQGGARLLGGLTFDHAWEKPVGVILDHFALERASLVGISMGGWWALRAAALEPRIQRVVSWSPVYDWLSKLPRFAQRFVRWMVRFRRMMNPMIRFRMRLFPILDHAVRHAMFLVDGDEPMDAVDWLLGMNAEALHSDRITQDVLLMVGEDDAFQSPKLADAQQAALTGARTITRRDFTRSESASSHCQMGNLGLACSVLTNWLQETQSRR